MILNNMKTRILPLAAILLLAAHSGLSGAVTLTLPKITVNGATNVSVPVSISDATGISSILIQVNYDPTLFVLKGIVPSPLGNQFTLTSSTSGGAVTMVFTRSSDLPSGSGSLVNLLFTPVTGAAPNSFSDLAVARFEIGNSTGVVDFSSTQQILISGGGVTLGQPGPSPDPSPTPTQGMFATAFAGASAGSDTVGDGIASLLKYAFGGTTNSFHFSQLPKVSVSGNSLVVDYLVRTDDPGLLVTAEVSPSLSPASWSGFGIATSILNRTNVNGFAMEERRASVSIDNAGAKFLRIKVLDTISSNSVVSETYGYSVITSPRGGRVITPVFVNPPAYAATATVNGNTLPAANLIPNSFGPTGFPDRANYPSHYLEVTSGPYAGICYDIASNTSAGITVYSLPAEMNGLSVAYVVRPHVTLGDVRSASYGLTDYNDSITLWNGGSIASSFYYTANGILAEDYATSADQAVVYPGSALMINNVDPCRFVFIGQVKSTATVIPIYVGSNLIGPLDPEGGRSLASLNLASALEPYSDAASLVSTDGLLGLASFYSDGSLLLDDQYKPLMSEKSPRTEVGNGLIINAGSNMLWNYTPTW
jgi:hypothetical protein